MLKRSQPIFAVRDVKETVAFYRNVLGFTSEWFWGTPVGFGGAGWSDVHVMFCLQPEVAAHVEGHQHHYWADDLETLHAQHQANGAPIISPIENKPWGLREYTVRDPNGYHLRFSGPLTYERPASATGTMPPYIQIVERQPTWEEFCSMQDSVGWGKSRGAFEIIQHSRFSFVAIDTRTQTVVGRTRVMQDAENWHSVWDVIVRPEYQGQRIGTALMETAVARIREVAPHSIVYLFTMKPEFYDRLGFRIENVTMQRL